MVEEEKKGVRTAEHGQKRQSLSARINGRTAMAYPSPPITLEARKAFLQDKLVAALHDTVGFVAPHDLSWIADGALIRFALERCHGNLTKGGRLLGMTRMTFKKRVVAHGFDHVSFGGQRGRDQRRPQGKGWDGEGEEGRGEREALPGLPKTDRSTDHGQSQTRRDSADPAAQ